MPTHTQYRRSTPEVRLEFAMLVLGRFFAHKSAWPSITTTSCLGQLPVPDEHPINKTRIRQTSTLSQCYLTKQVTLQ
jgi:hypothetical protein